jgi:hypothetical protein
MFAKFLKCSWVCSTTMEQECGVFQCAKILHATRVRPETTAASNGTANPLTGRLILYGLQHAQVWRAELDLKRYALSALLLKP